MQKKTFYVVDFEELGKAKDTFIQHFDWKDGEFVRVYFGINSILDDRLMELGCTDESIDIVVWC